MINGIRYAEKNDIPALCEIWESCFNDSREYIELFYHNNAQRIKALVLCADGKPVSMLHIIDSTLKDKDTEQPALFIYATGTLPDYRKKGCMSALIKYVTDMADERGYALFLKPSSESTARLYKSFGFKEKDALNLVSITPCENQLFSVDSLKFNEYNRMREAAFCNAPHAMWDDAHIKWCVLENEYFSGKTLEIIYDNKSYFLLGYPEGNALIINETDLSVKQLKKISRQLCDMFGTEIIKAYMPASCEEGESTVCAMLYNSHIDNPYINMIMI